VLPDWPGIHEVPVLTHTGMMGLNVLPQHLIVVGGSYIGLEFAQMFRRFGAQVTVLDVAERVIAREDPDVSGQVQAILEREGVRVVLGRARCRRGAPRRADRRVLRHWR
jgi:pyruvate/2-oxoglutarate dehydrogenase complex dihydrolipoamide dehydrogenase (E3) component